MLLPLVTQKVDWKGYLGYIINDGIASRIYRAQNTAVSLMTNDGFGRSMVSVKIMLGSLTVGDLEIIFLNLPCSVWLRGFFA